MLDETWVAGDLAYSRSVCQFSGHRREACAKCVEVCPQQALRVGEEIVELERKRCTDCGDCVSACPSGALAQRGTGERPLGAQLVGRAGVVWIVCEGASWRSAIAPRLAAGRGLPPGAEPVLVEGIGALSEVELAEAVQASGRGVVVLALGEGDGSRSFARAAEFMGQVTARLFGRVRVHLCVDAERLWLRLPEIVDLPPLAASPRVGRPQENGRSKRGRFREVLDSWLAAAPPAQDPVVIPHPAFAAIHCDPSACTLCGACANLCKVRALRTQANGDGLVLSCDPIACLNCGGCVAVCPEQALRAEPGLQLDGQFLSRRELCRAQGLPCAACGRVFTTAKRAERVSQRLLAARGADAIHEELRKLCPECRGKKALFAYGSP